MYTTLLTTVISTINNTVKKVNPYDELDQSYNLIFNPREYAKYREGQRAKEELGNKIIIGATALAVVGELAHIAHRSGLINKILKR